MDKIQTKKCSRCGEVKAVEEFHKDKCNRDGLRSWCKMCTREQRKDNYKEYYKEYREKNKERIKKYHEENKERRRQYLKQYQENNKDVFRKKGTEYQENNRIQLDKTVYHINTCPEELKPLLIKMIKIREIKSILKQKRRYIDELRKRD